MAGVREDDRLLVEDALRGFLAKRAADAEDAPELYEEISRAVGVGGKRFRPAFCLMGFRAGGRTDVEAAVPAAAALELLHAFALMHDDVMDHSPLRRGAPATYVALASLPGIKSDAVRFGEGAAVLAGDMAMVLADVLWEEATEVFPATRRDATGEYHRMREEVVAGQFLDLYTAATGRATPEQSRRISILKSGRYSVERPLLIGAALAGASGHVRDALRAYGAPVGEAFQLRDDILGVFGDPMRTGKDAYGDLREGKQTLLVTEAHGRASVAERDLLDQLLGTDDLAVADAERIRVIIRETGALEHVGSVIEGLLGSALEAIQSAPIDEEARSGLADLAQAAAVRDL